VVEPRILVRELTFYLLAQMHYHVLATDKVAGPVAP
jgi:hypothetical protein